jgi:hypothetical protein
LLWIISAALFVVWLALVVAGKGGFVHILILCAAGVAVVEWTAYWRARRG